MVMGTSLLNLVSLIHRAGIFNKLNVSVFLMLLEFFEYTHTHTHTHTNTSKKKKIILEKDVKRRREAENYLKKFPGSQGVFCFILVTYDIRDLNTFNCL